MTTAKKALLELNPYAYSGKWFSTNVESAEKGLKRLGYQIQGFEASKLQKAPLDRKTIVKGSIHTVRMALHYLGLPQPENLDIPESLRKYTHRKVWNTTLGAVRKASKPVFIKPAAVQKGFVGHVFNARPYENGHHYDYQTDSLPSNYKILASEVVNFETEWRVYVLKGQILGVRTYEGGYMGNASPSPKFLNRMIEDFKEAPVAYAMDVGKIRSPKGTVFGLVEVNEGFSLGNYGIPHIQYARMVEARWKEMTKT